MIRQDPPQMSRQHQHFNQSVYIGDVLCVSNSFTLCCKDINLHRRIYGVLLLAISSETLNTAGPLGL